MKNYKLKKARCPLPGGARGGFLILLFIILNLFQDPTHAQFFKEIPDSIAVGDSASAGVDLNGMKLVAIITPDTLEQDTLTFWTSSDNVTWKKLHVDKGSGSVEVKLAVSEGVYNGIYDPKEFYAIQRYLKIQYGITGADVDATGINDNFKIVAGRY